MRSAKRIVLAATLAGSFAFVGCDPIYRRAIVIDADRGLRYPPREAEEARVLAAVDEVAVDCGFAPLAPPDRAPRGHGEEMLRRYELLYQPDERWDKHNTLVLTVIRRASSGTIDVRLEEAITNRETPKYRQVFTELRRRLPDGQPLRRNSTDRS